MFNQSYEHHEMPPIYWSDSNDYQDFNNGVGDVEVDNSLVA